MRKTLYICYFGVREPLVQTQVIPYLLEIAKGGTEVSLLTFEPAESAAELKSFGSDEVRAELSHKGIRWYWLRYHKRPSALATAWDVLVGAAYVGRLLAKEHFDVLHCRVHIPMLMGALARKVSRLRPKLIFDIRGFLPEEYTDAGVWPEGGWLYRTAKRVERWLMKEADGFVVLTEKARNILFPESRVSGYDKEGRPVEVIPCCVDIEGRFNVDREAFRSRTRSALALDGRMVFVHAGALGGLYLTEQIADLLAVASRRDPGTFAMFLTQSDPELIRPLLLDRGFGQNDFLVTKIDPTQVSAYLCAADAGLSFVKSGYATQSRSPTKIPEYLACGLPVIANKGVGDVDELFGSHPIGVLVEGFREEDYEKCLDQLQSLANSQEKCVRVAGSEFDLVKVGGRRYSRLYGRLLGGSRL